MPTRHPRKMITINPSRTALLDEVAALEGTAPSSAVWSTKGRGRDSNG